MFFVLSKIVHFFLAPLSWVFILIAVSFIPRFKIIRNKLIALAVFILFIFSNPFMYSVVSSAWNTKSIHPKELKTHYKAIVVLGGFVEYPLNKDSLVSFVSTADRLFKPLRFLFKGIAPKMIISGGSGSILFPDFKEGNLAKQYLVDIGIPDSLIIAESKSRNTYENAIECKKIIQDLNPTDTSEILLVTSAVHMPRAYSIFKKQGIKCQAFPVNANRINQLSFANIEAYLIPSSKTLLEWEHLLHEWVGYVSYKIMGYL